MIGLLELTISQYQLNAEEKSANSFFLKQQKVKNLLRNVMSDQICTPTNEIK